MGDTPTPTPPPSQQFRSLVDRSHFVGDASRTGSKGSRQTDPEAFESMLDEQVAREGPEREKKLAEGLEALPEEEESNAELNERLAMMQGTNPEFQAREAEQHTRERGLDEAEKSGAGGSWRGPQPIVGLAALTSMTTQPAHNLSGDKPRSDKRAEKAEESLSLAEARVDPELVAGLVEAGLARPLLGLADPRLAGAVPRLDEDGWREVPSGFVWEKSPKAYQRLEWDESRTMLETAVGERVQWLEKRGNQVMARMSGRETPRDYPG